MQSTPPTNRSLTKIKPSLFGVFPVLPTGQSVHVWLDHWFTCCLENKPEIGAPLTLEIDTAPGFSQKISVEVAHDSEKYRDTLLSKWMQAGAPELRKAPPESILALIVSQFPGTSMPVWNNAFFQRTHWQQALAKATTASSHKKAAKSLLETLVLETPLLDLLKVTPTSEDALLGMEHGIPESLQPVIELVRVMVANIHQRPGALILADTTRSQREFEKVANKLDAFGWLAVCGERPAEMYAQSIADNNNLPTFQIDAHRLKHAEWLYYIGGALIVGKECNLGVLRQRAMRQYKEAISEVAFNDAQL